MNDMQNEKMKQRYGVKNKKRRKKRDRKRE
jgi:hypothetical protein